MHFVLSALSIVLIDLLLAGDNALVIAMAVRSLTPRERGVASSIGALGAVALRIGLTIIAAEILSLEFIELAGGLFVVWIAFKVLKDACTAPAKAPAPRRFFQAIGYIIFADLTMSADNILAIAGASKGQFSLIIFGLMVSIPFVIFSSNLLAKLMDKYPALIYFGSAILGKVGADMICSDPFVIRTVHPADAARYALAGALILSLLLAGRFYRSAAEPC
jgi:YjbE family integral membrane protein